MKLGLTLQMLVHFAFITTFAFVMVCCSSRKPAVASEPITIADDDIELIEESALSAMPDGLLHNLTNENVAELIAYLMHPTQVPLP